MPKSAVRPSRSGVAAWPSETAAHYVSRGYWEGRSLGSHLADSAARTPSALCLVDGPTRITYRELMARADGAAARMRALGLRPGDRIVLQLPNSWEHVVMTVACLRLGVVPVWAVTQYRRHELLGVVTRTRARALVVPDVFKDFDHQALAMDIARTEESVDTVLVAGPDVRPGNIDVTALCAPAEDGPQAAAFAAQLDAQAPGGEEIAVLKLSGGTTGQPKLVARTHNDLAYMVKRAAAICRFGPDTTYLAVLPLGHGFPYTGPGVLGTLLTGGRVVITRSPAPEAAFAAIEHERVTATSVVPAITMRWLEYREENPDIDLSSLRLLQVGASRLAPQVAREIGPKLGCTLQQVFGMAEGLLCLTRLDDPDDVIHHTQGRPISPDDEIRVVDTEGRPVEPGHPGLLLTRGPYTLRSYYASPATDARSFTQDGWYRTGDLVRRCPDGNLVVIGRDKDLINRGGEKIQAEEVEDLATRVESVEQAAAVAMPDAELGERVCLFVVPAKGALVSLAAVRRAMTQAEVAVFKLPEHLFTLSSLPTTPLGKVDKKKLRDEAVRRLAAKDGADPGH